MNFEFDFFNNNDSKKDATCIILRWKNENNKLITGIIDGGLQAYTEKLISHLKEYYFNSIDIKLDFVICSHPHTDHVGGLVDLIDKVSVKTLYANFPWNYSDELYTNINDNRITEKSLKTRLQEAFPELYELEKVAIRNNIITKDIFQGKIIEQQLRVLSPSYSFYLEQLVNAKQTDFLGEANYALESFTAASDSKPKEYETWNNELLKDDVKTDAINETSTVILCDFNQSKLLTTGDVGILGLQEAIDYARRNYISLFKEITHYEIPHHGSRHNVSPFILDQLVGNIVSKNASATKRAYASVAKDSDHPREMVSNAFIRRGCKVFATKGNTIYYQNGFKTREGWSSCTSLSFMDYVTGWN